LFWYVGAICKVGWNHRFTLGSADFASTRHRRQQRALSDKVMVIMLSFSYDGMDLLPVERSSGKGWVKKHGCASYSIAIVYRLQQLYERLLVQSLFKLTRSLYTILAS
jgi:hypothetical protein